MQKNCAQTSYWSHPVGSFPPQNLQLESCGHFQFCENCVLALLQHKRVCVLWCACYIGKYKLATRVAGAALAFDVGKNAMQFIAVDCGPFDRRLREVYVVHQAQSWANTKTRGLSE